MNETNKREDFEPNLHKNFKYVKTDLSPKQYYFKVYKKELETEKIG